MADTASVTINVKTFHGLNNRFDPAKLCELDPVTPVALGTDPAGRLTLIPGDPATIRISGTAAIELTFTIMPPNFVVAGVVANNEGFDTKGSAKHNFAIGEINGNTIKITNRHKVSKTYWELFIAVQEKSSGLIGIIDPGVENQD